MLLSLAKLVDRLAEKLPASTQPATLPQETFVPLPEQTIPAGTLISGSEREIIRLLSRGDCLPAKIIAKRLGRRCNSYFRNQLSDLTRRNLLHHTADGYRITQHPNSHLTGEKPQ